MRSLPAIQIANPPGPLPVEAAQPHELSVVVVVRNDEERIGRELRELAGPLRAQRLRFELVVVDEGSSDNTLALLALLRREMPELQVVAGARPGQGLSRGVERCRGRQVKVLDLTARDRGGVRASLEELREWLRCRFKASGLSFLPWFRP